MNKIKKKIIIKKKNHLCDRFDPRNPNKLQALAAEVQLQPALPCTVLLMPTLLA